MTVLLASRRLVPAAAHEAREACKALDLESVEWVSGPLDHRDPDSPIAVIASLDPGERRIPAELVALLDAAPAAHLVLCAQEPLVKPRVVLGDGRVCVLGPPADRIQLGAALRAALWPHRPPDDGVGDRRFEALRRSHWIAWTRGRAGPAISLHEQRGATVVLGPAPGDRSAIADVIAADDVDADREAALGRLAGPSGVAHLTRDAAAWVLYWPSERFPLWIYSPNRLPALWNAARGIAAVAHRRLLRVPAFPEDQLVAAWTEGATAPDVLAPIQHAVTEGGSETILGLDELARRTERLTGLVMEIR